MQGRETAFGIRQGTTLGTSPGRIRGGEKPEPPCSEERWAFRRPRVLIMLTHRLRPLPIHRCCHQRMPNLASSVSAQKPRLC